LPNIKTRRFPESSRRFALFVWLAVLGGNYFCRFTAPKIPLVPPNVSKTNIRIPKFPATSMYSPACGARRHVRQDGRGLVVVSNSAFFFFR
jgi:hypothetical protein